MPEHQQTQQSKKTNTIFQKQATPIKQIPLSNPMAIIQRAKINPKSLTHADVMQLQRTIGNRAVGRLLSEIGLIPSTAKPVQRQEIPEEEKTCPSCVQRQEIPEEEETLQGKMAGTVQRQEIPEEEEPLQGKMIETIQRQEIPEEEEPLQGRFKELIQLQEIPEEEDPLQGKMIETVQRQEIPDEEEPLQGKMIDTIQRQEIPEEEEPLQTKRENNTGMPDNLKAGVESLSGMDMSDVRVHYNSDKPAEVGALAYTQGTSIHVAPGQEKHLPHEAWHVVQQAQGRVKPTMQLKDGFPVNDDEGLEHEADVMGSREVQMQVGVCQECSSDNYRFTKVLGTDKGKTRQKSTADLTPIHNAPIQCVTDNDVALAVTVAAPVAVNAPNVNIVVVPNEIPLGAGGNPAIFVTRLLHATMVMRGMEAQADNINLSPHNRQIIVGQTVVIHEEVLTRPRAMRAAIIWHEYGHAVTGAPEPGAYLFEVTQLILAAREGQFANAEVTEVLSERLPQYLAGMTLELRQMLEGWTWN